MINIKFVQRRNNIVVDRECSNGVDITDPIIELSNGKWKMYKGMTKREAINSFLQYDNCSNSVAQR